MRLCKFHKLFQGAAEVPLFASHLKRPLARRGAFPKVNELCFLFKMTTRLTYSQGIELIPLGFQKGVTSANESKIFHLLPCRYLGSNSVPKGYTYTCFLTPDRLVSLCLSFLRRRVFYDGVPTLFGLRATFKMTNSK